MTVFGATGGIGAQVVDRLRSPGHTVTAYVRNPDKVPATWGNDVAVVVGEITDAAAIDRAVKGADAVSRPEGRSRGRRDRCSSASTGSASPLPAPTSRLQAAQIDDPRHVGAAPA